MFWLFLLGAVTVLVIFLRRVLKRESPLNDELFAEKMAIDHVHSGAAWVAIDGKIGSMNPALIVSLGMRKGELVGQDWKLLFAESEKPRVEEAYTRMVLNGTATFDADSKRTDGSVAIQNVVLVAVYDRKMRFIGHHCLTEDRSREKMLENRVRELTNQLEQLIEANEERQRVHSGEIR